MKVKPGDLLIINKTGTIGFATVAEHGHFSIEILKRGSDSKAAWYDFEEATVLVPMSQSLEQAEKVLNSPLYKALR